MDVTTEEVLDVVEKKRNRWRFLGLAVVLALVSTIGIAGASGSSVNVAGDNDNDAVLNCSGGMSRLGHPFDGNASVFPGDPAPAITIVFTVADDGFLLESVETGTHTGTHLDAPIHFIEGGRSVDQLEASEFVWPAYVVDVRGRMATEGPNFQLTKKDVKDYEKDNGKIPKGALVIIQTGFDAYYGTPAFLGDAPGFSGAAVQWMFNARKIGGLGSDTFGPDATSDPNFDATYTALLNDGVTVPGLNNLDSLNRRGDIIIASAVPLTNGSGYQVDPLACHGSPSS